MHRVNYVPEARLQLQQVVLFLIETEFEVESGYLLVEFLSLFVVGLYLGL